MRARAKFAGTKKQPGGGYAFLVMPHSGRMVASMLFVGTGIVKQAQSSLAHPGTGFAGGNKCTGRGYAFLVILRRGSVVAPVVFVVATV